MYISIKVEPPFIGCENTPLPPFCAEKAIFAEWPTLTIYTKKVYIQPINLFAMSILPSPPLVLLYPSLGRNVSHMGGAKSEHGVLKFAEGEKMVSQKKFNRW